MGVKMANRRSKRRPFAILGLMAAVMGVILAVMRRGTREQM